MFYSPQLCIKTECFVYLVTVSGGPGPEKKNRIAFEKSRIKREKSRRARNDVHLKKRFLNFKKSFSHRGLRRLKNPH